MKTKLLVDSVKYRITKIILFKLKILQKYNILKNNSNLH